MTDITMRALRRHPFGTGTREEGEEYVATASEAKVLESLGWASRADASEKPAAKPSKVAAKQTYRTRDMKAKG